MTTHTHKIRKTAKADSEKLPDISGTKITYAGGTECTVEVTQRMDSEPSVSAGSNLSVGAYTGICEQQQAEILPQYKLGGAVVWEIVTTLATEGDSI
ncbi:MAG: hypothetical protein JW990_12005 [Thermoleophilia bacterium]|nr:hypothetical protein [Thermoleophilia bacterium]